jgi:maltose alpha-D-glucosyltransferase/alpha-amylase
VSELKDSIRGRRWFRGKARTLVDAEVVEVYPLDLGTEHAAACSVLGKYEDGGDERYVMFSREGAFSNDALTDGRLVSAFLEKMKGGGTRIESKDGTLVFRPLPGFDKVTATSFTPQVSEREQTNTSIPFGDAYILKIIRKLDEGRSAELEMGEFLTRHGYPSTAPVLGAIEIERPRPHKGERPTVGVIHRFLENRGDAWEFTLATVAKAKGHAAYEPHARLLGKRVREMHDVLAKATENETAFTPEPLDRDKRKALAEHVAANVDRVKAHMKDGDAEKIATRTKAFVDLEEDPIATRVHGDLHLGQILVTPGEDFIIIDFEGEPGRPLAERKAKRSPMADVAGMLRSFDYATATAKLPRAWYDKAAGAFLEAYGDVSKPVLDFYLIEKCLYEIEYEANNRPDWIAVPVAGLRELLG